MPAQIKPNQNRCNWDRAFFFFTCWWMQLRITGICQCCWFLSRSTQTVHKVYGRHYSIFNCTTRWTFSECVHIGMQIYYLQHSCCIGQWCVCVCVCMCVCAHSLHYEFAVWCVICVCMHVCVCVCACIVFIINELAVLLTLTCAWCCSDGASIVPRWGHWYWCFWHVKYRETQVLSGNWENTQWAGGVSAHWQSTGNGIPRPWLTRNGWTVQKHMLTSATGYFSESETFSQWSMKHLTVWMSVSRLGAVRWCLVVKEFQERLTVH